MHTLHLGSQIIINILPYLHSFSVCFFSDSFEGSFRDIKHKSGLETRWGRVWLEEKVFVVEEI